MVHVTLITGYDSGQCSFLQLKRDLHYVVHAVTFLDFKSGYLIDNREFDGGPLFLQDSY